MGTTHGNSSSKGAAVHGLLPGATSGGVVLSILFLGVGLWIWRRRRVFNRFGSDPEDERHLFRSDCKLRFLMKFH